MHENIQLKKSDTIGNRSGFEQAYISSNLIFYPLEVVSRQRDPQLQVGEN